MKLKVFPGLTEPENKPVSLDTVWSSEPLFIHVIVVPTGTVMFCGMKENSFTTICGVVTEGIEVVGSLLLVFVGLETLVAGRLLLVVTELVITWVLLVIDNTLEVVKG